MLESLSQKHSQALQFAFKTSSKWQALPLPTSFNQSLGGNCNIPAEHTYQGKTYSPLPTT